MHGSIWSDLEKCSFQQGYLDAGGIRTRFLASGNSASPLLIFLHGTGGHAEAYVRNLAEHGKYFWTFAIDMVGHGWSDKPTVDYEIPTYANHVLAVVRALGRQKAHISGESLGGWVATYLAIHYPHVVDRLVLNTAGGWTAHLDVMSRIRRLSIDAVEHPTYERLRARLEFLMFDKSKVNDDLIDARRRIYSQTGYLDIMRRILCLQEMPIRSRNMFTAEDYACIRTPTFVLWTSHDPTASVEEGKELASMIPGSEFALIQNCGHWPQFEEPQIFNDIHIAFLRSITNERQADATLRP